jgi:hypothetical protein
MTGDIGKQQQSPETGTEKTFLSAIQDLHDIWGATTQDARTIALHNLHQIYEANILPGDTTVKISGSGMASGKTDHPVDRTSSKLNAVEITLTAKDDNDFSATYTRTDHETQKTSRYEVSQNAQGDVIFQVTGVEAVEQDAQTEEPGAQSKAGGNYVVSLDGTTTHNKDDTVITVEADGGTILFQRNADGSCMATVQPKDGEKTTQPISKEDCNREQGSAHFVDWKNGLEDIVPPPV